MIKSPILILWGEPNSIFTEIFLKTLKIYKHKKPIILIGSKKLLLSQLKKLKMKLKYNQIYLKDNRFKNLSLSKINLIDVKYKFNKPFEKISSKSNNYIAQCFKIAFKIISKNKISGIINGPISKKFFLKDKFKGVTEYFATNFKIKEKFSMLIYNKSLSVMPITTHLPISKVPKNISKRMIILKITLVDNFFKKFFNKKPKVALCGLNPHCENFLSINEDRKILKPAVNFLKKKNINVSGPFPADTVFLKQNRKKFDVIVGMYHDQVLTPIKALYEFKAINITLGLPIIRISPDHGPNFNMIGKNKSNPQSLIEALKFIDK
jgi:4-hydroxythreonine-4-phosphate dehydrogenase